MEPTEHIKTFQGEGRSEGKPRVLFPPGDSSWFSAERVEYLKNFFSMVFFALAFPYLMLRFFSSPLGTIRVVGQAQVGG